MEIIYIVMYETKIWKEGGTFQSYASPPHVKKVFSSYERALEYVNKKVPDWTGFADWKSEVKRIPGSDCGYMQSRYWIVDEVVEE